MIDLSQMKSIRVDPLQRTARAEPGVKLGEFDHETQAFHLATTAGVVSDTGIAGLTLGGGMGWLARKYGLSCDNLLSVDIVMADGRFLTASATENADLFWGVRGGGGNFGIITSFEYRLHPVGPLVWGGFVSHPVSKAKEVLTYYEEFSSAAPDELTTLAVLAYSPEGEPVVNIGGCYHGPLDVGEQVLQPLKAYGPPLADMLGPMPYTAVQKMFDQIAPPGWRYYLKAGFITGLGGDAIDIVADHFARVPSRSSLILFFQLGGQSAASPQTRQPGAIGRRCCSSSRSSPCGRTLQRTSQTSVGHGSSGMPSCRSRPAVSPSTTWAMRARSGSWPRMEPRPTTGWRC
jgi:FAD binding domain